MLFYASCLVLRCYQFVNFLKSYIYTEGIILNIKRPVRYLALTEPNIFELNCSIVELNLSILSINRWQFC
jgi:hypothetical protein